MSKPTKRFNASTRKRAKSVRLASKLTAVVVAFSLVLLQIPVSLASAGEEFCGPLAASSEAVQDQAGTAGQDTAGGAVESSEESADEVEGEGSAATSNAAEEASDTAKDAQEPQAEEPIQADQAEAAGSAEQQAVKPAAKKSARAKAKASGKVAAKTADELKEAAANADVTEIVLGGDIVIDEAITIDHAVTISGASLSRSDRTKSVFVVTDKGNLTLKDISLADNGKDDDTNNYASAIATSGQLNLNSGAIISGFKAADGGAVYAKSGSSVVIDGATLSNNLACAKGHAAMGGAVYAESGSSIAMTSGVVDGNTACSANSPDVRNGGIGGGFCLAKGASMTMDGGAISNNIAGYYTSDRWVTPRNGAGGGVFVNTKAGFIMNGGTVSGNEACAGTSGVNYYGGGGICIWNAGGYDFTGLAQINAGSITGNTSVGVGGGLYVHNYRLLPMHNAAVVTNSATTHGGGLYLCMVGEVYNFATDGTILTNNAAAGDKGDYAPGDDLWSDEPWGGSKANFHLPERTESGEPIAWYEDTRANPYTDASEPIEDFTNWFESNKNNNVGLRCDAPYDAANYALIVSGNKAQEGGGIGCNGILEMCNPEEDDVPLTVKKVWDDGVEADSHAEVTINVFNGEKKIDTVKLNKDNEWKATLTGLPADGTYTVAEEEVEGFVATVEKTSETAWEFTVTNKSDKKPVTFAKTDIAGNEIGGAELALLDADGKAVTDAAGKAVKWTSEAGKTKVIDLKPGTYTLTELTAPTGYRIAQNITFTLASDGKVTAKDANGGEAELADAKVVMVDKFAEAFVDKDFTKCLYASNMDQTFKFTMAECDAQGTVLERVAPAVKYERDGLDKATVSADEPITVTVKNSASYNDDCAAAIDFPQLRYTEPGTHYYRVSENAVDTGSKVVTDEAWFLIAVEVKADASTGALEANVVSQKLFYDGDSYDCDDDELTFYNNEMMTISCMGMDYGFAPASDQELVLKPAVSKKLNGRSMVEGEFNFKMTETTPGGSGSVVYASNDALGKVAFDTVSFAEPGTYTYEITELAGNDATVSYSDQVVTMTVVVSYDDNGALKGEPVYSIDGDQVEMPTFVNTASKPIVRVQKTSKDGSNDPLAGAAYGLWMQNEGGSDVYLGSELSDEDGYVTFDGVDFDLGASYYFKEVSAPAGHTVDEYPSGLFKVVKSANAYTLVYEGDEGFDASGSDDAGLAKAASTDSSAAASDGSNTVLTYEKDGVGVQDEVVKLEVSKFDKATHEYVEGAEFQIVDEASGDIVATWKSGSEAKALNRQLNVDTRYVLQETAAPDGYAKAADTTFTIGENGNLNIVEGEDAEATGKYALSIYDTSLPVEKTQNKEVVTKTKKVEKGPNTIVNTGDQTPLAVLVVVLVAAAAVAVVVARKRRQH